MARTLDDSLRVVQIGDEDQLKTSTTLPAHAERVRVRDVKIHREEVALIPPREDEKTPAGEIAAQMTSCREPEG